MIILPGVVLVADIASAGGLEVEAPERPGWGLTVSSVETISTRAWRDLGGDLLIILVSLSVKPGIINPKRASFAGVPALSWLMTCHPCNSHVFASINVAGFLVRGEIIERDFDQLSIL